MNNEETVQGLVGAGDVSLLIVDDDKPFLTRLARAMETRGFQVETAESVEEAVAKARAHPPAYAVVDMRLGDGNGLDVVAAIREKRTDSRTIILTGVGTAGCVETTAREGFIRDYYVVLVSDGTAAQLPEDQESTERNIRRFFGEVASMAELRAVWDGSNSGAFRR